MDLNKVDLTGNITKDPELKKTQSGLSICTFTIAVNGAKKKDGSQTTNFIFCQAWKEQAENLCKYAKKGDKLVVSGAIQVSNYMKNNGEKMSSTQVVCSYITNLGRRIESGENSNCADQNVDFSHESSFQKQEFESGYPNSAASYIDENDDFPF